MPIATKNINAEKIQGNLSINSITANTITATTISGGTLYGDGSNLTGLSTILNVGTTQITNGTDTRVLFQSGTTLQQDGNFTFDPTLKQLTLRAGGTLSTDIPFRVRNSGNTANILTVTGNDFVGINTDTQVTNGSSTTIGLRVNSGGVNYLNLWNSGGVSIGNNAVATYFNSAGNTVTSVAIGLNTYSWQNSVAIGPSSTANSTSTISIGQSNTVGGSAGTRLVALGSSIDSSTNGGGGSDNIAIGNNLITGRDNNLNIVIGTHLGNRFNFGGSLSVNRNIYIGGYLDQPTNSRNNIITLGYGVSSVSKITPSIDNSFQVYFSDNERSFFVNKNSNVVLRSLQSLTSGTNFDANATNTITISTGTTPSTNIVDSAQIYVTDRGGTAGRASTHFRSEDGTINVLGDLSGIGTSSPQARLDVRAQGILSTDIAFRVRNSGDTTNLFQVNGDGTFSFPSRIVGDTAGLGARVVFGNAAVIHTQANHVNITGSRIEVDSAQTMLSTNSAQNVRFTSSSVVNSQIVLNFSSGQIHLGGGIGDVFNGNNIFSSVNGTAPTSSLTDRFLLYSADRGGTAGRASAHFRSEDGTINVLGDRTGINTSTPQARLHVANADTTLTTGLFSGTGQNILTVIGSGNSTTSPIFTVQGSSGELFSVTDSLVGSLFSVNDISGLPIMEVFSDNTTLWGSYQAPSLNTTTRTSLTAGTNTIYSIPTSAYTGAFYEYTLISTGTTGARAGQIMSIWSGSTTQFTETSTLDIGTTTGVTFTVAVSGNNAVLSSSATTAGWTVKTIIRSI